MQGFYGGGTWYPYPNTDVIRTKISDATTLVAGAEEVGCPVILQAGPGFRAAMPVAVSGVMFRTFGEVVSVPVLADIDSTKTIVECQVGIDAGFISVMYAGSALPLDENITNSCVAVELAHRLATNGAVTDCPLVIHGASGVPEDMRCHLAINTAVCRLNVGNELRQIFGATLRRTLDEDPTLFDRLQLVRATKPALMMTATGVMQNFMKE